MADVFISEDTLTAIGDAIRAKTSETGLIDTVDMASKIEGIMSGNKLNQLVNKTITEVTAEDLEGVEKIGCYAFSHCVDLKAVTIPDSVNAIDDSAFSNCHSLTTVAIPDSVTTIGSSAFSGCNGLTDVTIPGSVTTIGGYAFNSSAIYWDDSNWVDGVLYFDNCLLEAKSDILPSNYTIKDGTRVIANSAFSWCDTLEVITIPDSVNAIDENTFCGCTSLTDVTLGNSVTTIGACAFSGCSNLTSVTIPDSITTIGGWAFSGCANLASVVIPDSVTYIGDGAFSNCTGLTSVIIPDSVTAISYSTFGYCSNLTSVAIPDSVTTIFYYAFEACTSLTSVIVEGNSVKTLEGSDAFSSTPIINGTGYIYIKPTSSDVDEAALVEEYKNATNWSLYADQIKPYSEYTEEE